MLFIWFAWFVLSWKLDNFILSKAILISNNLVNHLSSRFLQLGLREAKARSRNETQVLFSQTFSVLDFFCSSPLLFSDFSLFCINLVQNYSLTKINLRTKASMVCNSCCFICIFPPTSWCCSCEHAQ